MSFPLKFLVSMLFIILAGCSNQTVPSADRGQANDVLFTAMNLVGTPYRYGGNTPTSGFDCSGLVDYVYRTSAGLTLPRTVAALEQMPGPAIGRDHLESGDLLIFATGFGYKPDHAGIYVGKGRFVHAPSRGGTVRLDRLNDKYWTKRFLTGKRPLVRS